MSIKNVPFESLRAIEGKLEEFTKESVNLGWRYKLEDPFGRKQIDIITDADGAVFGSIWVTMAVSAVLCSDNVDPQSFVAQFIASALWEYKRSGNETMIDLILKVNTDERE